MSTIIIIIMKYEKESAADLVGKKNDEKRYGIRSELL